ncbi:hypothetical protein DEU38_103208 [Rhodococcus sp. AG1013]|uniref:hypothetical protein n=1 Tax=Rhodococcus sp. AG1013 TaxID=2183996 RepID=UPI000E0A7C99|nr:hypothetical protein [Rhodococcus sp. AG1013]RDI32475.1 hypothetical protein DEU38_103208 [Rhodococcus sp. AG1013]
MARRASGSQHPFWVAFGALFVLGLIIKFWWVIVLALILAGAVYSGVKGRQRHQAREAAAATERANIAARAEYEHQQYLAGDDIGIYGQYQPPKV